MLKRISIHNFNCFVDFELELPRRLLLVGSNGSGKTSLWEVLAGLQDVIVRGADVSSAFPTSTLTRWRQNSPVQRFGMSFEIGEEAFRYEIEIVHDVDRKFALTRREHLGVSGKPLYECIDGEVRLHGDDARDEPRTRFPFNRKRSFLSDMEARRDNRRTIAFREVVANMWLLAPTPQRLEPTTPSEAHWLNRDGRNFPSWFRGILAERPELGTKLLEILQPTMPGLRKVGFQSVSAEVRELMLTFEAMGTEYKLSAGELSDGQRTLLLLHGFLLGALDRAAVAFLDEPEIGLAPHEIQPWLSLMSKALDEHEGQAIVISHHPEVIDYIAAASAIRFRRPRGGPVVAEHVTLETTGGMRASEWLSRPWAYEDEHEEEPAP